MKKKVGTVTPDLSVRFGSTPDLPVFQVADEVPMHFNGKERLTSSFYLGQGQQDATYAIWNPGSAVAAVVRDTVENTQVQTTTDRWKLDASL